MMETTGLTSAAVAKTLSDEELARAIARAVADRGGSTYYVGGYVRDQILGRPSKDVDIEVHGIPVADLEGLLADFGELSAIGASFGVYNLKGHALDICVPRREDVARGGKGELAEAADPFIGIYRAALRRDLTMNALYQDVLTGEVIDHFGGQTDLAAGVIRHVDDETFAQDPLRVLRVAQFAARFGMTVAPETIALCARLDLAGLPSERVLEELRKALTKAECPSVFFESLWAMEQLDPWFAEVKALKGLPQNPEWHPEGDVWTHTMLVVDAAASLRSQAHEPFAFVLSALCHDFGKAVTTQEVNGRIISHGHDKAGVPLAKALLDRLGASAKVHSYVLNMVELHMAPNAFVGQQAHRKAYNRLFDRAVCPNDLLLLALSDDLGCDDRIARPGVHEELVSHLQDFEELMARPYVQGRDLLELGMEPGPELGEVLRYAHKLRLAGLSKEDQLRQCEGYLRSLRRAQEKKTS